jgi:23S rRNA G2445 N2-methylase RlmL
MASGLPPGRLRPAPLKGTCLYDPKKWESLVESALAKSAALDKSLFKISASDRNKGGVTATESNAKRAGVFDLIKTETCAFTAHPWLQKASEVPENLLLGSNLPFGRRLELSSKSKEDSKHPLLPLYQSLANVLNSLISKNSRVGAILLTDQRKLIQMGGFDRQFDQTLYTKHGGIPVSGMLMNSGQADSRNVLTTLDTKHGGIPESGMLMNSSG